MAEPAPALSVVVASAVPGALGPFWAVLWPQAETLGLEVVIADATGSSAPEAVPNLIWLPFPAGTPTPSLWGAGLAAAQAERLAVLDTTGVPAPNWAASVIKALDGGAEIVGGGVEPDPEGGWTDVVAYVSEYAQFMRPLAEGVASEVPGNNVAFRRDLLAIGREYTSPAFWKTYWCGRLAEAGVALHADASFAVVNAKRYRLGAFLLRRYRHGRCFGGMRVKNAPRRVRAARMLMAPLVPAVLFARVVRKVWPKGRHRGRFVVALPGVFLSALAWGFGEGVGTVAGPGDTCRDLT